MSDWSLEKVHIDEWSKSKGRWKSQSWASDLDRDFLASIEGEPALRPNRYRVTVMLKQKAEYTEQTVLGFSLDNSANYQVRIPIMPQVAVLELPEPGAVEMLPGNCVRVEVELPCEPTQIAVDPDQVLLDRNPTNNYWKADPTGGRRRFIRSWTRSTLRTPMTAGTSSSGRGCTMPRTTTRGTRGPRWPACGLGRIAPSNSAAGPTSPTAATIATSSRASTRCGPRLFAQRAGGPQY